MEVLTKILSVYRHIRISLLCELIEKRRAHGRKSKERRLRDDPNLSGAMLSCPSPLPTGSRGLQEISPLCLSGKLG